MRTYSAQVVPDEAVDGRVVRTSLQRGPHAAVVVCGGCAAWLAVGHRPDDAPEVLLVCSSCGAVNDPRRATPGSDHATALAVPAGLAPTEVWAKSAVERVHALAAQERRWPWRADRSLRGRLPVRTGRGARRARRYGVHRRGDGSAA